VRDFVVIETGKWTSRIVEGAEEGNVSMGIYLPGTERGPMNLIKGVRSAWAAACRRARVAFMVIGLRANRRGVEKNWF
jgi:hypothetical protein